MLIGMRNGMVSDSKLTAKSYVQDGLVAIWDGIENAGWGERNTDLKFWPDLVSGRRFMPWQNSKTYFGWEADRPWAAARMECNNFTIMASNGYSIDFICDFDSSRTTDVTYGIFAYATSGITYSWIRFLTGRVPQQTNTWGANSNYNTFLRRNCVGLKHCAVIYRPENGVILYIGQNSLAIPEAIIPNASNATIYIGNGSANNIFRNYPRIGIYSRALTAEEIYYNYAVDKARFNLPQVA